jgi:hypothetical protein
VSAIAHHLAHPHGWWWLVDLIVFGSSTTLGIYIGNED